MDNISGRAIFLCPSCKYGHFFRTVKSVEGIPYDTEYTCGPFGGSQGPGGWDGKTCHTFVEGTKKDPLEGCEITVTYGRLDKPVLVVDGGWDRKRK
jgi:hypothetical protein